MTNKHMFLSPAQLKTAERDTRYIPGAASAVSRVLFRMTNTELRDKLLGRIAGWQKADQGSTEQGESIEVESFGPSKVSDLIEQQLRKCVLEKDELRKKGRRKSWKKTSGNEEGNEKSQPGQVSKSGPRRRQEKL